MALNNSATTNVAIIGKIPGYGSALDKKNTFGKILLRDITYIDLIPATYTINTGMLTGNDNNWQDFYIYSSGDSNSQVHKIFKNVIKNLGDYALTQFVQGLDAYPNVFANTSKIEAYAREIIKVWKNTSSVRILAANDSTFTETIANNFTDNNSGSNITNLGMNALDKIMPSVNNMLGGESVIGKIQNMSYGNALDALTAASTKSGLFSLLTGRALGVQFATPNIWQSSSYNSTLNIFIKLASPSGDPLSILKYITLPILTMMSTGAPITINGVTYAMPLIWDVRAYGITHFKIGAVAAMTISRGSYETVFNSAKQPLLVDVRLTIVPLMQDFAVQYTGGIGNKTVKSAVVGIGNIASNASDEVSDKTKDLFKSISNSAGKIGDTIKEAFTAMEKMFDLLANESSNIINTSNSKKKNKNIYGSNGLNVQSPGDEIDGLMGLAYEGPAGTVPRSEYMKLKKYNNENGYIAGFANSYTFKI